MKVKEIRVYKKDQGCGACTLMDSMNTVELLKQKYEVNVPSELPSYVKAIPTIEVIFDDNRQLVHIGFASFEMIEEKINDYIKKGE